MTTESTSQTLLTSQTGAIAWSISARAWRPRELVPANRSQIPAPKSTPPAVLYAVIASSRTNAIRSATSFEPLRPGAVRRAYLRCQILPAPARGEPQQERDEEVRKQRVDHDQGVASIVHTYAAGASVTASDTRISPWTIQGWRPTSV